MVNISQQQALKRWDFITPVLREALFSEPNADFVWKVCQGEHLSEKMSYDVAGISGYVLLGFIHPGDLADELKDELRLSPQAAKAIADAINERVFAPLRADIDKAYDPPSKLAAAPKVMDVGPSPAPLPQTGWSQIKPTGMPAPTPPKPSSAAPANPANIVGEFARISAQQPKPAGTMPPPMPTPPKPPGAPRPANAPAEPAPFMLHQDTNFQPLQTKNDFRLSKPDGDASVSMAGKAQPSMSKPAILEFEGKPKTPAASSVTHYTELLAAKPAATTPPTSAGPRNISEITASPTPAGTPAPVPPPVRPQMSAPPLPPQTPQAPKPPGSPPPPPSPQAPQGKIVNKDYL